MGSTTQIPTYVLSDVVKTDVLTVIPADIVTDVISKPPFLSVPGLFNIRDVSPPTASSYMRPKFIFRSATLSFIDEEGKIKLAKELGLRTIFDLRNETEREKMASPDIPGVETRWLPHAQEPGPIDPDDFLGVDGGVIGMVKMYEDFLKTHVPTYRAVFEHIRDFPDRQFLFHCTAGKDRTGVLAALILRVAGCPAEVIAQDYTLTRIGVEPARERLVKLLLGGSGSGQPDPEKLRRVVAVSSVHYETMMRFLTALEEKFECGASGYVKTVLGFSEDGLEKIRANLKDTI